MNLDFYHWGPHLRNQEGEWLFGYLTGSGLPMRFVDEEGQILNIFQTLTNLADDHMLSLQWDGIAELTPAQAVEAAKAVLERARTKHPSAIFTQFHVDPYTIGGEFEKRATHFLDGTLGFAAQHGLPIMPADKFLAFTESRRAIDLSNNAWELRQESTFARVGYSRVDRFRSRKLDDTETISKYDFARNS